MFYLSLIIGKIIVLILRISGRRGTALPGLVVERIYPRFLQAAVKRVEKVIVITGTNGKTSTQTCLSHLLKKENYKVIVNGRGANLSRGLVAELLKQLPLLSRKRFDFAVFEVEEATLPKVINTLQPELIIVTNFFRDQLDAYGEIDRTKMHVRTAIEKSPSSTVLANADDPQVLDCVKGATNSTHYIRIKGSEDFIDYEKLDAEVSLHNKYIKQFPEAKLNSDMGVNFNIDGVEFSSLLPGYHSYYAIALSIEALSLLAVNSNIEDLSGYISELKPAFGRGEIIDYVWKDKKQKLQLFLVKNPVGFDLTLELFSYLTEPINLVILINDQIADGKDVSWLWDSQLEKLSLINYHKILIGGSRGLDMNLRIKYAIDSTDRNKVFRSHTQIIDYLADKQLENVKVIATYTAMNEFRDIIV